MEFIYMTIMSRDKKYIIRGAGINSKELLFPVAEAEVAMVAPY